MQVRHARILLVILSISIAWLSSSAQSSGDLPLWIWYPESAPGGAPAETRYFRKTFELDRGPQSARLQLTADNRFKAWLNGQLLGEGDAWQTLYEFDASKAIQMGKNVLAIEATNEGGPAGLVVRLELQTDGKKTSLLSDGSWQTSDRVAKGWLEATSKMEGWLAAKVLGPFGKTAPWTGSGKGGQVAKGPKERFTVPPGFVLEQVVPPSASWPGMPEGKHVSFVNCCFDVRGRLLVSQEQGPILLCASKDDKDLYSDLAVYCDQVRNCQGMCWAHDALYLVGDGPKGAGLYRCRDTKGKDRIDDVTLLHRFKGGMGEHGPHAVVHGPDDWLYLVVGNHSFVHLGETAPKDAPNPRFLAGNSPLRRWPTGLMGPDQNKPGSTEDVLLPRLNDANGHAANILAPGGTIWRCDREGQNFGLVSAGYRNQFDAAFNPAGELFSYDSDMEWDIGLPWYRHVRVVHAPMGSDFGWRTGAANQPAYFFDFLPPLHDTGRGSPVGVECYDHTAFPRKYQGAILCADWSVGIVYSVHPEVAGAGYQARVEKFITGQPMNVSDLAVGPDGALYLTLGGRNTRGEVYRLRWKDHQPALRNQDPEVERLNHLLNAGQPLAPYRRAEVRESITKGGATLVKELQAAARKSDLDSMRRVRALDYLHQHATNDLSPNLLVDLLKDADASVRAHAVQLLGTRAPVEGRESLVRALKDANPFVQRRACEALIRAGIEPPVSELWPLLGHPDRFLRFAARSVLERIDPVKWADRLWDIEKSNVYQSLDGIVALCRTNRAEPYAEKLFDWLQANDRPSIDNDLLDLVRTVQLALFHTKERPASLKALARDWAPLFPHPDWRLSRELAVVLAHLKHEGILDESFQGRLLQEMLKEKTEREQQIHYFYCLRVIDQGWNTDQKRGLVTWFEGARSWTGGNSFAGFLQNIFKDIAKNFTPADRQEILAEAEKHPWSAAMVLQTTPVKDLPAPEELSDLYGRLKSVAGLPRVKELREQVIAALAQNVSAEGQAAVRRLADVDADAAEFAARSLAKRPSKENWPYLVKGLEAKSPLVVGEVVNVLRKMPERPTLSNPPTAEEARPFRSLILASARLKENDRSQAAQLLRHWGNKRFALEDGDWKAEITGWVRWYGQTFPKEPPLPNAAALTATSKWKANELLAFLDTPGKAGDPTLGRKVFEKANCAKCHKFGSVGEGIGPDLTTLKARFKRGDLLEALVDPSKVISDQYRGTTFVTKAGQVISGLAAIQGDQITVLQLDGTKATLRWADVDQQAASTTSPMPERLLDELTREEIASLIAFLESAPPQ